MFVKSLKSSKKAVLILFVICFVIRLALVSSLDQVAIDTVDGFDYHNHAITILKGEDYPARGSLPFMRPPLYPFFLAGVYAVFPHETFLTARVFNAVVDSLTCVFLFFLVLLLFDNRMTAFISSLVFAVNPLNLFLAGRVRVEPLFGLLLVLTVYFLVKEYKKGFPNASKLFFTGIISGLSVLCRPNALMFAGFIVIWLIYLNLKKNPRQLVLSVCFGLGCALVMTPWIIRNYVHYHEFMLTSDAAGYALWISNAEPKVLDMEAVTYQEYLDADTKLWQMTAQEEAEIAGQSMKQRERHYFNLTFDYIKNNFPTWMWLNVRKTIEFWSPFARFDMQGWKAVLTFPTGMLMLFGLFIFIRDGLKGKFDWNIWLLLASLIFSSAVAGIATWSSVRYRVPMVDAFVIPFFIQFLAVRFGGRFEKYF